MFTYYVHIPGSEYPTAEVEASSTKHARTVYLDYLSRSGKISWRDRQKLRPMIKISRMNPGEIRTQVTLEYNPGDGSTTTEISKPDVKVEEEYEPTEEEEVAPKKPVITAPTPVITPKPVRPVRHPFSSVPIMELSRRTGGL